ncbi:C-C motif chemokine 23-like [Heterocephalus glaber]|uniref:C-C motif chemokine n=1 Tax=Heterocephalus glaber TaxID=10181 RepID=A0AAX6QAD7_HETGA|nr:C-C motif chemokine 23-like [Heterocephalus glaber]
MKVFIAALSLLILAAALGTQAQIKFVFLSLPAPQLHAEDCCFSYTSQRIRCTLMEDYFETSGGCPKPGVIFITKKKQQVCADPENSSVQKCITILKANSKNRKLA